MADNARAIMTASMLGQLLASHVAKRMENKDHGERGQRRRELRKIRAAEADKEMHAEAEAVKAAASVVGGGGGGGPWVDTAAEVTAGGEGIDEPTAATDGGGGGGGGGGSASAAPAATSQRVERMREVAANRQPNLYIVLEQPWNPGNVAAVMRSCDVRVPCAGSFTDPKMPLVRRSLTLSPSPGGAFVPACKCTRMLTCLAITFNVCGHPHKGVWCHRAAARGLEEWAPERRHDVAEALRLCQPVGALQAVLSVG